MKIGKETITPKKAMDWLKRNVHNRPLSQRTVDHYARAMTAGQWKFNGDAVRFNGNGDLIDGQHRLSACVKSGVSFDCYVVSGLDHDAFDTIDQGKSRKISDVFARAGYKHYVCLGSAVRCLWEYRQGWGKCKVGLRPDEANDILEAEPAIHAAVDWIRSGEGKTVGNLLTYGLAGFLVYLTRQVDEGKANEFWTGLATGENLTKTSPIYQLRERLLNDRKNVAKVPKDIVLALAIKAWNMFRRGQPCKLKYDAAREEFPTIE